MKLIKKHMTLEEYEAKYPKYQTKLLSFSDAEIKEFNNKFYKNNGNKEILDKHALLKKHKWVHINNRYYQVPRVSKLGKACIALGGAAAVACAVVLPLTLNGVNVSEKEFQLGLAYLSEYSADRKAQCEGTMTYPIPEEGIDMTIKIKAEIEGPKCKVGYIKDESQTEYYYENQYVDTDNTIYNYDEYYQAWRRAQKDEGLAIDEALYTFKDVSKHYSEFKKTSKDTYSVKDLKFKMDAPGYPGIQVDVTTDFEVSFNSDKTVKSTKQKVTIEMPKSNDDEESEIQTAEMDFNYKEVKTHQIKDFYEFTKPTSEYYDLTHDSMLDVYSCGTINVTKTIPTTFKIYLEDTHNVTSFSIQNVTLTAGMVKKINMIKSDETKTPLDSSKYTIGDEGTLTFTDPIAYDADECKRLEIECVFSEDVDEVYPTASCAGHELEQVSIAEAGQFVIA